MGSNILDELDWRGLIAQSTDRDALADALAAGPVTVYSGFDPTAPSLHAGHLIPLLTLRRFQQAGHRPIVLAGGATGMIGDPRDVGERTLQTADTVAEWADRIRGQLERFVEFDGSPTGAVIADNLTWTAELSAIEFLRDIGKHFSVNVMLDRDTVRRRLDGEGISYTEFSYMLLQANDFVELHKRYGCTLQVGGSDQWGNIIAGVRLVRQKNGASVHALTTPLVTDSEGKKFGKSTGGGSLWLDPAMTSPYAWYQYFINTADADVIPYLRWFTFLSAAELAELEEATAERPHERAAQRRLARELTTLVHGEARDRSRRTRQPGVVRPGGVVAASTNPPWPRRCARRAVAELDARRTGGDHRSACLHRAFAEQGRGQTDRQRGRRLHEQREDRHRRLGAAGFRLPPRQVVGAAPGQAEHRRRRAARLSRCPNVQVNRLLRGREQIRRARRWVVQESTHLAVRDARTGRKTRSSRPFDSELSLT